jgi:hypothetical protein
MEWKFASHACNYTCPECLTIVVLLYNISFLSFIFISAAFFLHTSSYKQHKSLFWALNVVMIWLQVTDACQPIEDIGKQMQDAGLDQVKGDLSPICPC